MKEITLCWKPRRHDHENQRTQRIQRQSVTEIGARGRIVRQHWDRAVGRVWLWTVLPDEGGDVVVASALQRLIDKALRDDGWFFTAPERVSKVGRVEEVVKTVARKQEGDVFVESALDHSTLNLVARADHIGQDVSASDDSRAPTNPRFLFPPSSPPTCRPR